MRAVRSGGASVAAVLAILAATASTAAPAFPRTGDTYRRPGPGSVTSSGVGAAAAAAPAVVIDGKGWGHGVGMAQDGAYAMGRAGASTDEILTAFYPGTGQARRGGTVRVTLLDGAQPSVILGFPGGGELRDSGGPQAPGFPVTVAPGGRVRISRDGGGYRATPVSGATAAPVAPAPSAPPAPAPTAPPTTVAPGPTTTLLLGLIPVPPPAPRPAPVPTTAARAPAPTTPPGRPDPAAPRPLRAVPKGGGTVAVDGLGRSYRGTVVATGDGGGLQLVNEIDVEQYLRGMGEVRDPGWPPAALRAQAIAARTYVLRAVAGGGTVCSDQQCQVYLGQSAEYGAMDKAVADTRGRVLVYQGALAATVYSASGGGVSATPAEGFGRAEDDHPYLRAAPYPTLDPQPWSVSFGLAPLAARFGYRGTATGVQVSRAGPSGRALEITFDGDAGPLAVDGMRFQSVLRLRSTLYSLRLADVDATTEAPVPDDGAPPAATTGTGTGTGTGPVPPMTSARISARASALGRAPWTALAVLLLAAWATLATRVHPRLLR